jgi:hypothetical protein
MSAIELLEKRKAAAQEINFKKKWIAFRQERLDPSLRKHLPNLAVISVPCLTVVAFIRGEQIWPAMVLLSGLIFVARVGHRPPKSAS